MDFGSGSVVGAITGLILGLFSGAILMHQALVDAGWKPKGRK